MAHKVTDPSLIDAVIVVKLPDEGGKLSEIPVKLDPRTKLDDLGDAVRTALGLNDCLVEVTLSRDPMLLVVSGASCYQPQLTSGLAISEDQPLIEYFKAYRRYHGLQPKCTNESVSALKMDHKTRFDQSKEKNMSWDESIVQIGPAQLRFFRTLRVPDDAEKYLLPPGLGTFPIEPVENFVSNLPEALRSRGGFLMPMFQREALWISFEGSRECAIKISVGGVNAITGRLRGYSDPAANTQDYVKGSSQPWLDGICTEPGVVRQFVAMKIGYGYTVEEQMTGRAEQGGIQVDVFPSLVGAVRFVNEAGKKLDMSLTPKELGVKQGKVVEMCRGLFSSLPPCVTLEDYRSRIALDMRLSATCTPNEKIQVFVRNLKGKLISVDVCCNSTLGDLKAAIQKKEGVPPKDQQLRFRGKTLVGDKYRLWSTFGLGRDSRVELWLPLRGGGDGRVAALEQPLMGIAAGGRIKQKIYADSLPTSCYDEEDAQRVWIHTVSSAAWECITGVVPPMTPIGPQTYAQYDYPWYSLYDEHAPEIHSSGLFDQIRSVRQMDDLQLPNYGSIDDSGPKAPELLDPDRPPQCSKHRKSPASCVFRPCGHTGCDACFGKSILSHSTCVSCSKPIKTFVGFKKPVPKIQSGCGSEGDWWTVEEKIQSQFITGKPRVVTFILDEDRVSPLHGWKNSGRIR